MYRPRNRHHDHYHHLVLVLLVLALLNLQSIKPTTATFVLSGQQNGDQRQNTPSSRELTRKTALHASRSRRSFVASTAAIVTSSLLVEFPTSPSSPGNSIANAVDIKVTPMAHTFVTGITKGQGVVKPTRENDFTRFLTNAKVVLLFTGDGSTGGEQEVTKLTKERKAGEGPGVTPGNIVMSAANKVTSLEKEVSSLGKGDTLIVTIPSASFAGDRKAAADSATSLGLFLGGAKEGGVVSVLVDGSKSVTIEESGYDLLWYSLSR